MADPQVINDAATVGKKRKRTGKEREERKRLAIQAAQDAENFEKVSENPVVAEMVPETSKVEITSTEMKAAGVDLEKASKRIPQALKSLHPTFKQAKSFEIRRLIKKIKFLRNKPDSKAEVSDLEAQLALLHDIQLHSVAQTHLLLKLRKHTLFKSTSFPSSISELLIPKTSTASATSSTSSTPALIAKVENRLCSAKNVAEAVKGGLSWILGEEGSKLSHPSKKEPKKNSKGKDEIPSGTKPSIHPSRMEMLVESGSENELGYSNEENDDDSDNGALDQQDFAADEAGWESGSVGDDSDDSDDGISIAADDDDISDEDAIPIPPTKRAKSTPSVTTTQPNKKEKAITTKPSKLDKVPKDGNITSSMFLPSLAAGFTLGDEGDSDPDEDIDPNGIIGKKTVERKNRRGQRARQAIWEKKFGKGAKHVVKAKEDEEAFQAAKAKREFDKRGKPEHMKGRDSGWGAKNSGSTTQTPSASTSTASTYNSSLRPSTTITTALSQRPSDAAKEDKKNLHPSWEAARLRKQKMGTIPTDAPKANKIVFD
ncbi:uncharacterized protein L201_002544 [Kwoniella dendrophila CBS 6074]|uniref:Bud22 domain-containing protein n=1 Tax=Kwoniella dendrophila CBS 6074 TaxID=1295534 RepID=A0AAX4JSB5_9TREE